MRPQKISQTEMLQRSALLFKAYGYHGTSMDMLAKSCGLTKAAFYYYYPNKNALLMDVVKQLRVYLQQALFAEVYTLPMNNVEKFKTLHIKAVQFFSHGTAGCLMAILGLDLKQQCPEIFAEIEGFFQDWQRVMLEIFKDNYSIEQAHIYAKQSIADYEGAILMMRIREDDFYLQQVKTRILALLQ